LLPISRNARRVLAIDSIELPRNFGDRHRKWASEETYYLAAGRWAANCKRAIC
jgi:hypothetical protein